MERVIRFLVVSILVLPLSFTVAQAQEEKNVSFAALVETRIGTDVLEYGSFSTADIGVHLGVSFLNRVSLTIPFEVMVGFYEAQRIFDENATIGISVGYDVLPKKKLGLEIALSGGTTFLTSSLSHAYADLTLRLGVNKRWRANPYIGVGMRYMHPYFEDMTRKLTCNFVFGFYIH